MQITKELIESLLWQEEETALDFKRDQYPFSNATNDEKSELLKDILACANAFRQGDAFILVGVEEVKGARSRVVGVKAQAHLDDADLQQFVNSKTQRPVAFSYRAMEIDGLPVAVTHVPLQERPVFLKKDFGKLKKETVYLRRGSGTAIAGIEEIARMGAGQPGAGAPEPSLSVALFDRDTGKSFGDQVRLRSTLLHVPPAKEIPDYDAGGALSASLVPVNASYYRQLATFTQIRQFVQPVSLAMTNTGTVSGQDVRLVFAIEDPDNKYLFMDDADYPAPPVQQRAFGGFARMPSLNSDIAVERVADTWRVECSFGKIQPQDTVRLSDDLYAGARESGALEIEAQIFADNLSRPRTVRLTLRFEADERVVSLDDIEDMEQERFFSTPEGRALLEETEEADGRDAADD